MPSILITGVSSGLGRALALRAHAEGWTVYGTTRSNGGGASDLPGGITQLRLELRFPHAVSIFTDRFLAEYGAPDVLVNNAATALYGPVEDVDPEALRTAFQVNVFAAVELATGLLPAMRERGSGVIVNITSLGGKTVFPFFTTYNATKHALEGFSEGLWHEVKPFGVRVKAIEPGYIATPIYDVMKGPEKRLGPYAPALEAMDAFSAGVTKRSTPEEAAEEVWRAILDPSDRLRYPVAAYARPLLALRRLVGDRAYMKFFHRRWVG